MEAPLETIHVYARAGEWVTCANGHEIGRLADDIKDHPNLEKIRYSEVGEGYSTTGLCQLCRAQYLACAVVADSIWSPMVLHIGLNWRDKPTAAPARQDYDDLETLLRAEDKRMRREAREEGRMVYDPLPCWRKVWQWLISTMRRWSA